jgi:hypothetical protein
MKPIQNIQKCNSVVNVTKLVVFSVLLTNEQTFVAWYTNGDVLYQVYVLFPSIE